MITSRPKIVLITGATRGLGRAMAEEFAKQGHTVLGCGRSKHAITQLGTSFGKPHDLQSVNVAADSSQPIAQAVSNSNFIIENDVLYKVVVHLRTSTPTKLIYIPSSMRDEVLQIYHDHPTAAHRRSRQNPP